MGGAPLGVAFTLDGGATYDQLDGSGGPRRGADADRAETGVLLAGSEGGGVLRSWDVAGAPGWRPM